MKKRTAIVDASIALALSSPVCHFLVNRTRFFKRHLRLSSGPQTVLRNLISITYSDPLPIRLLGRVSQSLVGARSKLHANQADVSEIYRTHQMGYD